MSSTKAKEDRSSLFFFFGLFAAILSFAGGIVVAKNARDGVWKSEAIEHECAQYHPKT